MSLSIAALLANDRASRAQRHASAEPLVVSADNVAAGYVEAPPPPKASCRHARAHDAPGPQPPELAAIALLLRSRLRRSRRSRRRRTEALLTLPTMQIASAPAKSGPHHRRSTPPSFTAAYLTTRRRFIPCIAKRAGEQGKVILRVHVAATAPGRDRRSAHQQRLAAPRSRRAWRLSGAGASCPRARAIDAVAAWVLMPITSSLRAASVATACASRGWRRATGR